MYNNYTSAGLSRLLLFCQVPFAVPLPVALLLAEETLSVKSGATFRLFQGAGLTGALALFGFALLFETGGLRHHHHMIGVFLHASLRSFKHGEQFVRALVHPIHVVVHDKAAVRRGK